MDERWRVAARVRALLLDFDGVILDSAALKTRAFGDLYPEADPTLRARIEAYAERHGGITRRDKIAYIERYYFGRSGAPDDVERLAARFRALVFESVVASPFVAGAEHLLALAQGSVALHVVSGTPHEELVEIVARRGLARWFASVHGAPPAKREIFARLLAAYGYAAAETLAIGDALTECEAARELGMPFLAVVPEGATDRFPADVARVPSLAPVPALLGLA